MNKMHEISLMVDSKGYTGGTEDWWVSRPAERGSDPLIALLSEEEGETQELQAYEVGSLPTKSTKSQY